MLLIYLIRYALHNSRYSNLFGSLRWQYWYWITRWSNPDRNGKRYFQTHCPLLFTKGCIGRLSLETKPIFLICLDRRGLWLWQCKDDKTTVTSSEMVLAIVRCKSKIKRKTFNIQRDTLTCIQLIFHFTESTTKSTVWTVKQLYEKRCTEI